ncbi:MAG: cysteine desulfurase NifS [Thermodesulfobacteriota bacterium]|nr:cysteine desulfurase NifS [Thermodesulfobacteriota bacterium]
MKRIYLDHAATTPTHPEVLEAMLPYYKEFFGNPSTTYTLGRKARKAVDEARADVASLIGADPLEIIFTSGGTEADNLAIKGIACAGEAKGRHIITSAIEHHAVLNTCRYLEERGFRVSYLPVDEYGLVDPDDVKGAITSDTILITIMYANNEVGTIEPVEEIGLIAKEKGILFHSDAVQAVGKIPVDVDTLNVDLLSVSGHKIYGPKGIGALYIKNGVEITPLLYGGGHERNLRAGTENVPGIVGLGKACDIASRDLESQMSCLQGLRDRLQTQITEKVSHTRINGYPLKRLPQILSVSFECVDGESIVAGLDIKGVAVSAGAACTSGEREPSHVLSAMGISPDVAFGTVRISLGRENTKEDIEYTAEILEKNVKRLRDARS